MIYVRQLDQKHWAPYSMCIMACAKKFMACAKKFMACAKRLHIKGMIS
jgi:hypothetical protein